MYDVVGHLGLVVFAWLRAALQRDGASPITLGIKQSCGVFDGRDFTAASPDRPLKLLSPYQIPKAAIEIEISMSFSMAYSAYHGGHCREAIAGGI